MPVYPGGDEALLRYISENVAYPAKCKANGIMGIVFVSYTVNRVGGIEDVKIARSSNELFNKEAVRVIKSITGYKPGMQKGKPIPVQFTMPLRFVLTDDTPESHTEADRVIAIELYNLGAKEFAEKNYGMAKYLFEQALNKTSSWFYEAFVARGKAHLVTGQYAEALADFERALKIKPQLVDVHLEKAKTHLLLEDKKNAIKSFENGLQIDSTSVIALQYLSELHYSNFEYEIALGYYERLVTLDQTQGLAYYYLGMCYAKKRDVPNSCKHMRIAFDLGVKEAGLFVQNFCTEK